MAQRNRVLLVAVLAAACGGSDAGPAAPSAPFTGTFSAASRITRCDPTPGLPLPVDPCTGTFGVGAVWPTRFALTQNGAAVAGTVTFFDQDPVTINVAGSVDAGNRLTASGASPVNPANPLRLNMTSLRLQTTGALTGDWTLVATATIGIGGQNATLGATVASQ